MNQVPTHAEPAQTKAAERRLEFDLVNRDLAQTIEIELVERVPHEMIELELVERDLYEKTIELDREAAQTTSIEKGKTQEADTKEIEDLDLDDLLH